MAMDDKFNAQLEEYSLEAMGGLIALSVPRMARCGVNFGAITRLLWLGHLLVSGSDPMALAPA